MTDLTHGPVTAPPAPADGLEVVGWRVESKASPGEAWEWIENREPAEYEGEDAFTVIPLVLKSAADARIAEQQAEIERLRGLLEEAREGFRTVRDYIADEIAYADHPSASVSPSIRQMMNDDMARIDAIIAKIGEAR